MNTWKWYWVTFAVVHIEPENELPCTKLLIEIEATIRRVPSRDVHDEEIIEDNIRYNVNQAPWSIELQYNSNDDHTLRDLQGVALSNKLRELQVPIEARSSLVDTILFKASEMKQKCLAS